MDGEEIELKEGDLADTDLHVVEEEETAVVDHPLLEEEDEAEKEAGDEHVFGVDKETVDYMFHSQED